MTLKQWRHLVEIVAIAGAAVWALYVFVYQERVKPASEPPEFQPTFTVHHTTLSSGKNLVKVGVEYRNAGQNTIYVAGDVINIYGVDFGDALVVSTSKTNGSPDFDRSLPLKRPTLLHSYVRKFQPFGNPTSFIDIQPGVAYTGSFAFAIPGRAFDALGLSWQTCFSKFGNRTWPVTLQRGHDGAYAFEIPDADWGAGLVCYGDHRELYPL